MGFRGGMALPPLRLLWAWVTEGITKLVAVKVMPPNQRAKRGRGENFFCIIFDERSE
jgi:hypothetical protein